MKYGPNTASVEEVIEFVRSGNILSVTSVEKLGVAVTSDLDDARRSAWEETFGEDEWRWTDIREREMSQVKARSYEIEEFPEYRDSLSSLLKTFTIYLKRQLKDDQIELLDDAIGDLYNCAFNRCVYGRTENFFENMFSAYKSGCWPCGWDGNYPDGRLRVYCPTTPTVA